MIPGEHTNRSGKSRRGGAVRRRAGTAFTLVVVAVAACLTCALLPGAGSGAAMAQTADSVLVIQEVDTADYPDVSVRVTIPAHLMATGQDPTFAIAENGESAEVLAFDRVGTQVEQERVDIVLAIDTSGSMEGASLESAKAAATEFVANTQPPNRVAIVSFDTTARVVSGLTEDAETLKTAIAGLEASGETAVYDAVIAAAGLSTGTDTNIEAIVLLSDGGDTVSRAALPDAVAAVVAAEIPVFAVSLPSNEADPVALQTIAAQSGGRLVEPIDLSELPALYVGIAQEIQDSFVVVYRSSQPQTKNLEIEVSATVDDATATGIYVAENPRFGDIRDVKGPALTPIPAADLLSLGAAVGLVFISVVLLVVGLALFIVKPRTTLDQLRYYEQLRATSGELPTADQTDPDGVRRRVMEAVGYVADRRGMTGLIHERLERAGLPLRPVEYMTAHITGVVLTGVVAQLVAGNVAASVLFVIVATFVPIVWIDARASARSRAFEEQLPEILTLIAGSLRAGWGMLQAVDLVVDETLPPARDEFRRVQNQTRLGLPVEEAMAAVAERVDSDDFRWTVSAIAIQREVGGNLSEVLDVVASTIRERGALKRHVQALTAEGKLSAYILVGLPFVEAIVLLIVNPSYMSQLFTTTLGLIMTASGVALLIVGAIWMRRAMVVEV